MSARLDTIEFLREQAIARRCELRDQRLGYGYAWRASDETEDQFLIQMANFLDRASWGCED